jgi:2-methylcitrate dehydratase
MLDPYTEAYPQKMKAKVAIKFKGGEELTCETEDYHGFNTRPFGWEDVIKKFKRLAAGVISEQRQSAVIGKVQQLDKATDIKELLELIAVNETDSYKS